MNNSSTLRSESSHCRQCRLPCEGELCHEHSNQQKCRRCGLCKKGEHFTDKPDKCNACVRFQQRGGQINTLGGRMITTHLPGLDTPDVKEYFQNNRDEMTQMLKDHLKSNIIKFSIGVSPHLERYVEGEVASIGASFHTTSQMLKAEHEIDDELDYAVDILINKVDQFVRNGSGYTVVEIDSGQLDSAAFNPLNI